MPWRFASAALAGLLLVGCGASNAVRADVLDSARRIDITSNDNRGLDAELQRAIERLRDTEPRRARDRRARRLAIEAFTWYRRGVQSRIAFFQNDSGNVYAAERDARREYNAIRRGLELLNAALRIYGKGLPSR
jgi:hypothetical protein